MVEKNRINKARKIAATRSVTLVFAPAFFRIIDLDNPPVTTIDPKKPSTVFTSPRALISFFSDIGSMGVSELWLNGDRFNIIDSGNKQGPGITWYINVRSIENVLNCTFSGGRAVLYVVSPKKGM